MACKINDKGQFSKALAFAKRSPKETRKSFKQCLSALNRIKRQSEGILCLHPDFVPHSFIFTYENEKGQRVGLLGGMILHGYTETFSVEINAPSYPHWSLHT
jgi:hypothetical protein